MKEKVTTFLWKKIQ